MSGGRSIRSIRDRYDQRHELDRHRRLRRAAGERAAAGHGRFGVSRLLHYGKALTDNVGYYGVGWGQTGGQGYYYLDSDHRERDYGPPPFDIRHNVTLSAIYELPFGSQRSSVQAWSGATNAVLGGWSVNTIFQAHTGLALTVIDPADQSLQAPHHGSINFPNRVCNGVIPRRRRRRCAD